MNEVQVSNSETMVNRVFIHEGLNNPNGHFNQFGVSHFGDESRNTSQDLLSLEVLFFLREIVVDLGEASFQLTRRTRHGDVCLRRVRHHPHSVTFVREHTERTHAEEH